MLSHLRSLGKPIERLGNSCLTDITIPVFRRNLPEGPLPFELIQVSYDISTQKTRNRELNGLLAGAKALKCDKLTLITFDTAETVSINGRTIEIVPAIDWLCQR